MARRMKDALKDSTSLENDVKNAELTLAKLKAQKEQLQSVTMQR